MPLCEDCEEDCEKEEVAKMTELSGNPLTCSRCGTKLIDD